MSQSSIQVCDKSNFNPYPPIVTNYSKSINGINTKHGILADHDKLQLQDKRHYSESYIFGIMSLFN